MSVRILRGFIVGRVSNFGFEDEAPVTHDPAVWAIWDSVWPMYDDVRPHKMSGAYRILPGLRREMARWILFLQTDLPYEWPKFRYPGVRPTDRDPLFFRERTRRFMASGDYTVWPFRTRAEYRRALRHPKTLNGRRSRPVRTMKRNLF